MENTYHVSGVLEKLIIGTGHELWDQKRIYQEVEANSTQATLDKFEVDGWEFRTKDLYVWLISEAYKMERDQQPTLFEMPPKVKVAQRGIPHIWSKG